MQFDKIQKLINESHDLMMFTMSMQNATKYKGNPRFDSANYSRILQEARKELEGQDFKGEKFPHIL